MPCCSGCALSGAVMVYQVFPCRTCSSQIRQTTCCIFRGDCMEVDALTCRGDLFQLSGLPPGTVRTLSPRRSAKMPLGLTVDALPSDDGGSPPACDSPDLGHGGMMKHCITNLLFTRPWPRRHDEALHDKSPPACDSPNLGHGRIMKHCMTECRCISIGMHKCSFCITGPRPAVLQSAMPCFSSPLCLPSRADGE